MVYFRQFFLLGKHIYIFLFANVTTKRTHNNVECYYLWHSGLDQLELFCEESHVVTCHLDHLFLAQHTFLNQVVSIGIRNTPKSGTK